jgi:cytosine/adenosine deaminase-related metal-dependent hydrolase
MSTNRSRTDPSIDDRTGAPKPAVKSRRDFIKAGAAGLAGTTIAAGLVGTSVASGQVAPGLRSAQPQGLTGDGRRRRILLRGGTVLSLDPRVGDFEKADVLIDGKTIAQIAPNIPAGNAEVVDCTGTIVMPGFITTHNHQYESLQRSVISDGLLGLPWPAESYGSVVQNIWTTGRIAEPGTRGNPGKVIWDLGRVPYDPEDLYTAELLANLSQISEGITTGTDTGQANHSPAHTDAIIKGHIDSGRRMLFDYSAGTNRSAEGGPPFEWPGAMNDSTKGIGRIAKTYFSSKDQLVTLGFGGGGGPAFQGADYTGWQLARSFGAFINNHSVGNPQGIVASAADARNGTDWSDITFVHATRWQDNSVGQIGQNAGYPNSPTSKAWEIVRDRGAHVSIAVLIEAQMRHGMPPMQEALNYGVLPSLSPDVDTNMTTDPFSLMRGAYCIQRGLANDLAFKESNPGNIPIPQLLTSRQCIEMTTIAGAAGSGLLSKVGTLTPGKEADIVVLDARSINTWPMNNVPGTIVTMMNPRHVRDVLIAGKVVYWKGKLVGWNIDRLLSQAEQARDRILARINGPAKVGKIPQGNNSLSNPYRPNLMGDCCHKRENTTTPDYVLRP